jgi:hypothetical protein
LLVEQDDDDGEFLGASIAGRLFTAASEVFVQVSSKTGALDYRLHVFVTRGGAPGTANDVPTRPDGTNGEDILVPGKTFGWVNASTTPEPGDGGHWLVGLRENERITVMVDGSPMTVVSGVATRPVTAPILGIYLQRAGQSTVYKPTVYNAPSSPSSLAFSWIVPSGGGDFIIRVATSTPGSPITILAARAGTNGAPFNYNFSDLGVELVSKTEPAVQGLGYSLTYRVTNRGSATAYSYALSVNPLSTTNYSVAGITCDDDPARTGAKRCPFSNLAPGQSQDLVLTNGANPSAPAPANWQFVATIVASAAPTTIRTFDVAPENDTVVTAVQAAPSYILSVSAEGDSQIAGNQLFLGVRVRNNSVVSPSTGTLGYVLTVDFAAPLSFVNAGALATCTGSGQQRVCTSSIGKNTEQSFTVTFTGTAGLPRGTALPVTFSIAPAAGAVDLSENDDSATAYATVLGTPTASDTDGDGLLNADEEKYGLDPTKAVGDDGPGGDPDKDGVNNATEIANGTHPRGFYKRYFAEGSTGSLFDERIALLNWGTTTSHVLIRYLLPAPAAPILQTVSIAAASRATIDLETIAGLEATAVSAFIEADTQVVADRTMSWDASGYGAHAETAVTQPRTTWYFAEGSTIGNFNLFYLLQNPGGSAASVSIKYLSPFVTIIA